MQGRHAHAQAEKHYEKVYFRFFDFTFLLFSARRLKGIPPKRPSCPTENQTPKISPVKIQTSQARKSEHEVVKKIVGEAARVEKSLRRDTGESVRQSVAAATRKLERGHY